MMIAANKRAHFRAEPYSMNKIQRVSRIAYFLSRMRMVFSGHVQLMYSNINCYVSSKNL